MFDYQKIYWVPAPNRCIIVQLYTRYLHKLDCKLDSPFLIGVFSPTLQWCYLDSGCYLRRGLAEFFKLIFFVQFIYWVNLFLINMYLVRLVGRQEGQIIEKRPLYVVHMAYLSDGHYNWSSKRKIACTICRVFFFFFDDFLEVPMLKLCSTHYSMALPKP